jgi:hypothetical protein
MDKEIDKVIDDYLPSIWSSDSSTEDQDDSDIAK